MAKVQLTVFLFNSLIDLLLITETMSSLSEFAIFKQCVENPTKLDKQLSQLNLQFIKDPAAPADQELKSPVHTEEPDLEAK